MSGPNVECTTSNLQPASSSADTRVQGAAITKLTGRFDLKDPTKPRFDWSGNAMTARFQGTEVTWGAESGVEVAYEEVIDGKVTKVILGGAVENHTVTRHLPDGFHEITVMRTSEALYGDSAFLPFTFGPGTTQLPVAEKTHRIEYIGDSITCGYGNEGANATCPYDVAIRQVDNGHGGMEDVKIPMTQNIYLAYGSIAARKLDAEATTICFSGKGVNVNYREKGVGEAAKADPNAKPDPDAKTVIPDYYLRTLATERPEAGGKLWDFSKEAQPEVVVLNLGTNDFARDLNQDTVPDGIDLPGFQAAYARFVELVRGRRPGGRGNPPPRSAGADGRADRVDRSPAADRLRVLSRRLARHDRRSRRRSVASEWRLPRMRRRAGPPRGGLGLRSGQLTGRPMGFRLRAGRVLGDARGGADPQPIRRIAWWVRRLQASDPPHEPEIAMTTCLVSDGGRTKAEHLPGRPYSWRASSMPETPSMRFSSPTKSMGELPGLSLTT